MIEPEDATPDAETLSAVERLAQLHDVPEAPPDPEPPAVYREEYLVVQCFNPSHKRMNEQMVSDPKCGWCRGIGLVRIRRDHVPVVRRVNRDKWGPADSIVDQIGDLASP